VTRLRAKLTFANVMSVIAVFLALTGVGYAAFKLPKNSVGPKQIRNGAVNENKLSASAKAALKGAKGDQGPQGPPGAGATSFTTSLPSGTTSFTQIATAPDGLTISGECLSGPTVVLRIATPSGNNLQFSGTENSNGTVSPADSASSPLGAAQTSGTSNADFDVIARDRTVGPFVRIDLHGHVGSPATDPCTYWGMITPSS
jgi:hypothetical protein